MSIFKTLLIYFSFFFLWEGFADAKKNEDKEFLPMSEILYFTNAFPSKPLKIGSVGGELPDPFWTEQGLWIRAPSSIGGLVSVEKRSPAFYDPQSGQWFASANGSLVRIEKDGRLTVILDDVQGIDLDVRAKQGMAVSREPNDSIVLHYFGNGQEGKKVLMKGGQFFNPRFSPDGSKILVAESRSKGGHIWIVSPDGKKKDLGQGYGASWHPDSKKIIFSKIKHNGLQILLSDLWIMDVISGKQAIIAITPEIAEIEPSFSPDGKYIAFVDAHSKDLYIVSFSTMKWR